MRSFFGERKSIWRFFWLGRTFWARIWKKSDCKSILSFFDNTIWAEDFCQKPNSWLENLISIGFSRICSCFRWKDGIVTMVSLGSCSVKWERERVCTLDILFSSNHNSHNSSSILHFWASDPLIDTFYKYLSIKGSEARKQRPHDFLWMFDLTKRYF